MLLNRRGYAPVLHCGDCGWKSGCPHCSAWRVFHKLDRTLRCHHCGFTERVPRACPDCGNLDIAPIGRGTERLEEQLAALLPGARIARIDADSTRRKGALEAQLGAVHAGEVDVLVGTQMVAKGHDFRRITLVAAVNPDSALFSSDFRAPERLFALLMQAAGRAGRDAAQAAAQRDVGADLAPAPPAVRGAARATTTPPSPPSQLDERAHGRAAAVLPPGAAARRRAHAPRRRSAFLHAAAAPRATLPAAEGVTVYPPVPPPVARVADVERMQMLVESPSRRRCSACWPPGCRPCTRCRGAARRRAHAALGGRRRPAGDLTAACGARPAPPQAADRSAGIRAAHAARRATAAPINA